MIRNEPIRVLLADDDTDDQLLFREAFEGIKIKTVVETVKNGMELMDHLLKPGITLPHILFLDLNMPKKDGREVLKELKQNPELETRNSKLFYLLPKFARCWRVG